jgi:ATPase family AAA domain-containing protein 3A/B
MAVLYTDVREANTTESLDKIRRASIKVYEYKYDSVPGRRLMGVLGADVERFFPDALDILPTFTIPNKNRSLPNIVIQNFPSVDKNVIFMHGFAALKELIRYYDEISGHVASLRDDTRDHRVVFEEIEKRLSKEAADQLIEERKIVEAEAELTAKEVELQRLKLLNDRELIDNDLTKERELWLYQESLARERLRREEEFTRESMVEALNFERETSEKKELMRRETEEKLLEMQRRHQRDFEERKASFEKEKIRAEIQARAEQERANEDVTIRRLQLEASLDAAKVVEGIKVVADQISNIAGQIAARPKQLMIISGIFLLSVILFYVIKELIGMLRELIQSYLGRPSLVRETSYKSAWFRLRKLLSRPKQLAEQKSTIHKQFESVILSIDDMERVVQLALSTRNTRASGAPYRHVLLHGPPGTGKTMIARRLAECSDMDYAIMSGGDVGPLGEDAVNQLHSLFKWASRSPRGLLVFIDEAEAFLSSRGSASRGNAALGLSVSEHTRHALNALLYQTGTQSKNFMLVLATNRPEDLDSAVLDRIDVSIHIGLPGVDERAKLIHMYIKSQLVDALSALNVQIDEKCISDSNVHNVAKKTAGFSGREISKLAIAIQYAAMLDETRHLTAALFERVLAVKLHEHEQKRGFLTHATQRESKINIARKMHSEVDS